MLLQTTLGASHVLGHVGGDRLHLLNASAAELWQLYQLSDDKDAAHSLSQKLTVDFGLAKAEATNQSEALLLYWRQNGLLQVGHQWPKATLAPPCTWVIAPPFFRYDTVYDLDGQAGRSVVWGGC